MMTENDLVLQIRESVSILDAISCQAIRTWALRL